MKIKIKGQIIAQCYHCGNKGLMNIICDHSEKFGGHYVDEKGKEEYDPIEEFRWFILLCPVCRFLTIKQKYSSEELGYNPITEEPFFEEKIIYPENKMNVKNVPKDIASTFESALKIKNVNQESCLVLLRKTLELICNEKKTTGHDLDSKVKDLINQKIFPKELKDAYWIIRSSGNQAAHTTNINLHNYDIKQIIDILYTIIDYLYITPNKIKYLKNKLEK